MSENPFQKGTSKPAAKPSDEDAAPAKTRAKAAEKPADLGIGDPFASPTGVSGEYITEFIGNLLLIKPVEWVEKMSTSKGENSACRVDLAVLDDADEPGRVVPGVLLFQTALKREAKAILEGPLPYLLGRLNKGKTGGGNDLYTFLEPDEDEKNLARQFIAANPKW